MVYSGHFYSWTYPINWNTVSYEDFKTRMHNAQTFIRDLGIPYWLGEFGTNDNNNYWKFLIRYIKELGLHWAYWALDGYQGIPSKDESYGILKGDWTTVRYQWMMDDLKTVMTAPAIEIE